MEFTPEQRLSIYKSAIEFLSNQDSYIYSLCYCISRETNISTCGELMDEFPEFAACKPKESLMYGYWWHCNDKQPRIKCLEKCIKEVKKLIK